MKAKKVSNTIKQDQPLSKEFSDLLKEHTNYDWISKMWPKELYTVSETETTKMFYHDYVNSYWHIILKNGTVLGQKQQTHFMERNEEEGLYTFFSRFTLWKLEKVPRKIWGIKSGTVEELVKTDNKNKTLIIPKDNISYMRLIYLNKTFEDTVTAFQNDILPES